MQARGVWGLALGLLGLGSVLAGLGLALSASGASGRFGSGAPWAEAGQPSPNMLVSATPLGDNEVVICLVDTAQQRLMVYLADAKRSRLKLLAVRDIAADWALTDYNNDPPLPKDVRARAEKGIEGVRPEGGAAPEKKPGSAP